MSAWPFQFPLWHNGYMVRARNKSGNLTGMHAVIPITDFRKQRLLQWLCTPIVDREPRYLKDLAEELGVARELMSKWKADAEFLEEWERMYRHTVGNPEKKQQVVDTMFKTAIDADDPKHIQAGKTWLEAVDAIAPQKIDIQVSKGKVSDLSADELAELMAEHAARELKGRKEAG